LLFFLHMFVMTIPNFSKIEPSGFPFIFYPFDQSCIFCVELFMIIVCVFFFCLIIVLIIIVLDFAKALNYKLFKILSCDFACVCVFCLVIKVCVLWFHVFCVSNLVIKLQIRSNYSTRFENEVSIHESVGGVGEITNEVHMSLTCGMFNVENVQPKSGSNLSS
jgi:hypothetical protein